MIKIEIPLADIIIDPVEPAALAEMPPEDAERLIGEAYAFLPGPLAVTVAGDVATITSPAESRSNRKTARLLEAANLERTRGNFERAVVLYNHLLEQTPDNAHARKYLGLAHLELEQVDAAEAALTAAANLEPGNAESLALLGDIYARRRERLDVAMPLYVRAAAAAPGAAVLHANVALALVGDKQHEAGRRYCDAALAADPTYAKAHYVRALSYFMEKDVDAALAAFEALYAAITAADFRADEVYEQAWETYVLANAKFAEREAGAAMEYLGEWRHRLAREGGVAIELEQDGSIGVHVLTEKAWDDAGRTAHMIRYPGRDVAAAPHHIAHELQGLALETAARAEGRGRVFLSTPDIRADALRAISGDVEAAERDGFFGPTLDHYIQLIVERLVERIYTLPLDFVIESRLYRNHPALRPFQLVALDAALQQNRELLEDAPFSRLMPRLIYNVRVTRDAALAIFVDHLYGGVTGYTGPYESTRFHREGRRLFELWQEMDRDYRPGDEYELVDRFAAALRLQRWYGWG